MARLRYNLVQGTLAEDLDIGATTITLVSPLQEGGVDIPDVVADDILAIRVDSEIMYVTAYTSGSTTATVLRGQESTVEADHFAGAAVRHVFTKEDVGGGGGGGAPHAVTVASSGTSAAVKAAADFVCTGTNDEAVFADAIAESLARALPYSSATPYLLLSDGEFFFDAELSLTTNLVLEGASPLGGARFANLHGQTTFITKNTSGNFPLFGADAASIDITLRGLQFNPSTSESITSGLLDITANNISVFLDHCEAYWWGTAAPILRVGGGVTIARMVINNSYLEGEKEAIVSPTSGIYLELKNSYLYADTGYAIDVPGIVAQSQVFIDDCYIDGCVRIIGSTLNGTDVRINNTYIERMAGTQHLIQIKNARKLWLTNNYIEGDANEVGGSGAVLDNVIDFGLVTGNHIYSADEHGIWVLDSDDVTVVDNFVDMCGIMVDNTYSGILLDGDTNRCIVRGNKVRTSSSAQHLYGVRVDDSTCDDNVIEDNDLVGSSKTNGNEFSDAGTNTRGWRTVELSYLSGVVTTGTGAKRNRFDRPSVIGHTLLDVNTAPAGSSLIADVHRDGTTIYTTQASRPTISDAANQGISSALPDVKYVDTGSYLTVDVDEVGSSTPGSDLVVYQRYMPL